MINKFLQIFNIIKALPFLILAYIYLNIGHYFYFGSNDDKIRVKYVNLFYYYLSKFISWGMESQIIYLNKMKINLEKITILNSNHITQLDIFVLLNYTDYLEGKNISSISTIKGINDVDKKILNLNDAILVNNTMNDIKNINNKINLWNRRKYNTLMLTFFEGISIKDSKIKSNKLNHLLDPKTLGFELILKNLKSKYMYDANLIYTYDNKLIDPNECTILHMFHPLTKVYVSIKKYELPNLKESKWWLNELYQKKDRQIEEIINKFNLSL